jgi:hypothetical protein
MNNGAQVRSNVDWLVEKPQALPFGRGRLN